VWWVRTIGGRPLAAAILCLLVAAPAFSAVVNKQARLREGPSRFTELLAWVEAGSAVDVLGEQQGWLEVMLPDGRRGFIWGEHVEGAHDIPPSSASEGTEAQSGSPGTLQDEIRELRADLERLRTDASVARRDDIDRLAERVEALTRTQQELGGLIEAGSPSVATPVDGSAVAAGTFLTVGLILGWLAARFTQGRRERRSRIRV